MRNSQIPKCDEVMMSGVEEPDIEQAKQPEEIFRRAVIKIIKNILERKKEKNSLNEYFILQNFGLDIAVFMKWSDQSLYSAVFRT